MRKLTMISPHQIHLLLIFTCSVTVTVQQSPDYSLSLSQCTSMEYTVRDGEVIEISNNAGGTEPWDNSDPLCSCSLTSGSQALLGLHTTFETSETDDSSSEPTCPPHASIIYKAENAVGITSASYSCPMQVVNVTAGRKSTHYYHLDSSGQSIELELINMEQIFSKFSVLLSVHSGNLTARCAQLSDHQAISESCPCLNLVGVTVAKRQDAGLESRFVVAIVCVIVFLLLLGLVLVGYWYYTRHYKPSSTEKKYAENDGSNNPAYTSSQPNIQDPELNLDLQKVKSDNGYSGSTDSGLYSIPGPYNTQSSAGTLGPDQGYDGPGYVDTRYMNTPNQKQPSPEELESMYATVQKPRLPPPNPMTVNSPAPLPSTMDTPNPQASIVGAASVTTPGLLPSRTPSRDELHLMPADSSFGEMYNTSHNTSQGSFAHGQLVMRDDAVETDV